MDGTLHSGEETWLLEWLQQVMHLTEQTALRGKGANENAVDGTEGAGEFWKNCNWKKTNICIPVVPRKVEGGAREEEEGGGGVGSERES